MSRDDKHPYGSDTRKQKGLSHPTSKIGTADLAGLVQKLADDKDVDVSALSVEVRKIITTDYPVTDTNISTHVNYDSVNNKIFFYHGVPYCGQAANYQGANAKCKFLKESGKYNHGIGRCACTSLITALYEKINPENNVVFYVRNCPGQQKKT